MESAPSSSSSFAVGDFVLLSSEDIDPKIQPPRFVGPYMIDERLLDGRFRLRVPSSISGGGIFKPKSLIPFVTRKMESSRGTQSNVGEKSKLGGVEIENSTSRNRELSCEQEEPFQKKILVIGEVPGTAEEEQGNRENQEKEGKKKYREKDIGELQEVSTPETPNPDSSPARKKAKKEKNSSFEDDDLSRHHSKFNSRSENGSQQELQQNGSQQELQQNGSQQELQQNRYQQRQLRRLRKKTVVSRDSDNASPRNLEGEVSSRLHLDQHEEARPCSTGNSAARNETNKQETKEAIQEESNQKPGTMVIVDGDVEWEVEAILEDRLAIYDNGKTRLEYLVKWKGYSLSESTWEPRANLTHVGQLLRKFKKSRKNATTPRVSTP